MAEDSKKALKEIMEVFSKIGMIDPDDVPGIPLYMDQVTTFMDDELKACKRYDGDKILTKTMINNYAKNDLVPPPDRKKYSKEHLLLLIFVYYFKNFLSISDIHTLLAPVTEKYFGTDSGLSLDGIYKTVCEMEKSQFSSIQKDILRRYEESAVQFPEANKKDEEFLHTFAFICLLSFDVYVRKQLIEQLIDRMPDPVQKKKEAKKPKK